MDRGGRLLLLVLVLYWSISLVVCRDLLHWSLPPLTNIRPCSFSTLLALPLPLPST